jgi:hypothetical protein
MQYDEIRSMNWDDSCRRRKLTPGQILADHVRRAARLLQGSTLYVWNDMFDPYHNAVRHYYLVNGDLSGSWEGLGRDIVIVNWNAPRMKESLRFFARRGHRQIIAGYFDGKPEEIRDWLSAAAGVPSVIGVMYTTWRPRYDDLEAFARACGIEGRRLRRPNRPATGRGRAGGGALPGERRRRVLQRGGPERGATASGSGQMTPAPGEKPRPVTRKPESRRAVVGAERVARSCQPRRLSRLLRARANGRARPFRSSAGHGFRDTARWGLFARPPLIELRGEKC